MTVGERFQNALYNEKSPSKKSKEKGIDKNLPDISLQGVEMNLLLLMSIFLEKYKGKFLSSKETFMQ